MSVAKQICTQITERLRKEFTVCPAWERTALPMLEKPIAVIGTVQTKSEEGAFWNYLGTEWVEALGCSAERYGRRFSAELSADIYAPREQAEEMEKAIQTIEEMAAEPFEGGVRIQAIRRGEVQSDPVSRYLKCRCTVLCAAYFTVMCDEEGTILTDFILKGVVQ